MVNKIPFSFLVFNGLFLATGGLLAAVFFMTKAGMAHPTVASVAASLLLMRAPLTGIAPFDAVLLRKLSQYAGQPLMNLYPQLLLRMQA